MSEELSLQETLKEWHGSARSYIIGFIGSLLLTGTSFFLVIYKVLEGQSLVYALIALAFIQAIVQLLFFLHVGQEPKPRFESQLFFFMVLVAIIIILGTLWIMYDLDIRVMSNMPGMAKEISHD